MNKIILSIKDSTGTGIGSVYQYGINLVRIGN